MSTILTKSATAVALACLLAAVRVSAEPLIVTTGQNLRRIGSEAGNPGTRSSINENSRAGTIESGCHAVTTIAFDLGAGATTNKAAFQSAREIQFTFPLESVVNPNSELPDLNIHFMGTYANPYSSVILWPDGDTGVDKNLIQATWKSVLSWNSPTGTYTVSTTGANFSGSIKIDENSERYAIFLLQVNNPKYYNLVHNRNYHFGTGEKGARKFVLTALP